MEIVLSNIVLAKALLFAVLSVILATFILMPINDKEMSSTQLVIYAFAEIIMFLLLFGFISIKFV